MGIIQELTGFLLISSSGHLIVVPLLLGWRFSEQQAFVFDILVQWRAMLAVVVYYWKDLVHILLGFVQVRPATHFDNPEVRLGWYLILATWGLWLILPLGFLSLLAQGLLAHPPVGERPERTIARVRTRGRSDWGMSA